MFYFISDLHLDESRPAVAQAFFDWTKKIEKEPGTVYILGDLFDSWIGDDDDNPFYLSIIAQLQNLTRQGISLHIMHGNRDFLLGESFAEQTGATLLSDYAVVDLFGEQVLLMHGDTLCTRDIEYMAFRQQVRSPQWQAQLLAQPIAARRALAQQLREKSQAINSMKASDIMDVTPEEVINVMREHQVRRLIHGHTHRPERHSLQIDGNPAERIVLGDWHSDAWCLEVNGFQQYELRHWAIT